MVIGFMGEDVTLPDCLEVFFGLIGFLVILITVSGFIGAEKLEKMFAK
ncbi:MAG: hypothetical protein V3V59_03280 [Thermodesulfovibrionales bacterium]